MGQSLPLRGVVLKQKARLQASLLREPSCFTRLSFASVFYTDALCRNSRYSDTPAYSPSLPISHSPYLRRSVSPIPRFSDTLHA